VPIILSPPLIWIFAFAYPHAGEMQQVASR
jgi:hypothetical protein